VDTAPAFRDSGAAGDGFMDSWASSHLRDASRGAAWDATGPSITGDAALPAPFPVGTTSTDLTVAPFSGRLYRLLISADVVQLAVLGHARLSDGSVDLSGGALVSAAFCTKDGGCACPDGSPLPEALTPLGDDAMFAISAADQPVTASIQGSSLEDFCKPRPSPSPGRDLWVHLETTEQGHGLVFDVISCNGPYGPWTGSITDTTTHYVWPVAKIVGEKTPLFGVDTSKNVFLWGEGPDTFSIPIQPAPAGRCP